MTSTGHGSWARGAGSQHRRCCLALAHLCCLFSSLVSTAVSGWPCQQHQQGIAQKEPMSNRMYPAEREDITVSGLFSLASQWVVPAWPARSQEGAPFWEKGKPKHAASLGWRPALGKGVQANEKQIQFSRSGVFHRVCVAGPGTCVLPYATAGPRATLSA